MNVLHLPTVLPCPVCGSRPDMGECAPWPKDAGRPAWYANCYSLAPVEHCVAVNGDSQRETMELWNAEVGAYQQKRGRREMSTPKTDRFLEGLLAAATEVAKITGPMPLASISEDAWKITCRIQMALLDLASQEAKRLDELR